MSVKYLTPPYVQEDGTIVIFYVADTEAERPSGQPAGTLCFTKDTNKLWTADSSSAWQSTSGDGGSGGEAFPVGSVFIATVSTNPATLLGYGTWVAYGTGRVLVGIDAGQAEFDTAGETGGAKTHTLQTTEIPGHTHVVTSQTATTGAATSYEHGTLDTSSTEAEVTEVTGSTGGGGAHNNLQPYIVVYMWNRTA